MPGQPVRFGPPVPELPLPVLELAKRDAWRKGIASCFAFFFLFVPTIVLAEDGRYWLAIVFLLPAIAAWWFAVDALADWTNYRRRVAWAQANANVQPPNTSAITAAWIGLAGVLFSGLVVVLVALID
jgi:hypothetical protein